MKFNTTVFAVTAMVAMASAVPQPNEPWSAGYVKKRAILPVENINASYSVEAIDACNAAGQPCDVVKRSAFAISDILKRHAEANPSPCTPGSICDMRRRDLGDIASTAIDGYDYVTRREDRALGKRSDENEGPVDLIKYCDDGTTFCARKRTADPEVHGHVKRCVKMCKDVCPQALKQLCHQLAGMSTLGKHPKPSPSHHSIPHPPPDPGHPSHPVAPKQTNGHLPPNVNPGHPYNPQNPKQKWLGPSRPLKFHTTPNIQCMMRPGGPCMPDKRDLSKRGLSDTLDDESTQEGGVVAVLAAIQDAVESIKQNAAGEPEVEHEGAWSPYGPSKGAVPYFHDIEHGVNAAVETFEA